MRRIGVVPLLYRRLECRGGGLVFALEVMGKALDAEDVDVEGVHRQVAVSQRQSTVVVLAAKKDIGHLADHGGVAWPAEERRAVVAHRRVRLLHVVEGVADQREDRQQRVALQDLAALRDD